MIIIPMNTLPHLAMTVGIIPKSYNPDSKKLKQGERI